MDLEPTAQEMRAMAERAVTSLIDFVEALPKAPASQPDGIAAALEELREAAPETGGRFGDILDRVVSAASLGFNTTGPGYLAYIPGGGLYAAALADFLAATFNRFVNVWEAAPAFAQIEQTVIGWFTDLFGYPAGSRGILTSGGSLSNFSAIVTARHTRLGGNEDLARGVVYVSEQAHASVAKAAVLAGVVPGNVRRVPCTPELRIDLEALEGLLTADRRAGLLPFCLVVSAGTTNTGAVDPISDASELARREALWLHVDGAYGGFFQLTERGRRLFAGIERADSIALDPHKTMFLPYGVGCLLVREGARLREAHSVENAGGHYLQDLAAEDAIPNFSDYSPELSRDFRGLRVWLPIQLHGLGAFRVALDEKLDLARFLHEGLRGTPGFEVPWEPELTVVAFRRRFEGASDGGEELNRGLLKRINDSRRVFLSSTMIGDRFFIRACIVSHRTHRDRVEEALDIIREAAASLASER